MTTALANLQGRLNPLKDISLLENVEFVMKEGKVYKGGAVCQK